MDLTNYTRCAKCIPAIPEFWRQKQRDDLKATLRSIHISTSIQNEA